MTEASGRVERHALDRDVFGWRWLLQSTLLTSLIDRRELNLGAVSEAGASCVRDTDLFSASSELRQPSNTSCLCRHIFCLWKNRTVPEPREQKSALLTQTVLSVEAGIEIDFRMVDSLLALELTLQAEEFNAMSDLVEFRHLKYIVAVAEAANITRAAERLFLAQPSLSKQVKDLEDEAWIPDLHPNPPGRADHASRADDRRLRPGSAPETNQDYRHGACSSPRRGAPLPTRLFLVHQSRPASALSRCLCQAAPGLPDSSVGRRPDAFASPA